MSKNTSLESARRTVRINTGSVKRLFKELQSYVKEETTEKERLKSMKEEGVDATRMKQQQQVIEESAAMIPFSRQKLDKAVKDLEKLLKKHITDQEKEEAKKLRSESKEISDPQNLAQTVEYVEAVQALAEIQQSGCLQVSKKKSGSSSSAPINENQ